MKGLHGKTQEMLLRSLGLFTPEKKLRGDLTEVLNILIKGSGGAGADLFSLCSVTELK